MSVTSTGGSRARPERPLTAPDRGRVPRAVLLFACLQLPAAFLSLGHHYPDEHFQILEFLNYTMGWTPAAALPWEFHEAIRPFVQIALYFPIVSAERILGIVNPFVYEITLRLVSASLGIAAFASGLRYLSRTMVFDRTALLAMACFAALPYLNARLSGETVGASIFFIGLFTTLRGLDDDRWVQLFGGGLLLGIAFFIRFHLAFMLLGVAAWLIVERRVFRDRPVRRLGMLAAGFLIGALASVLADAWGYERWVFTPWAYFDVNVLQHRADAWGVSPWWEYLRMAVVQMMPPLGVVALAAIGWFLLKRPRSIFVYMVIPFIVGHSLVGHKEYRFLFPLALPVTFMLGIVLQATVIAGWKAVALKAFAAFNLLWLIALPYRPASFEVMFYRHVYESGIREIYSMDRDPYTVADLAVHFYRPPDLEVHLVDLAEVERLTAVRSIHLFTTGLRPFADNELLASRCQADYRSVPGWVERVNINDWVSRVPIWSVYRCGPTGEKAE